ncbi:MAG: TonB-dependent receptor [Flavobacteriaceae bacterium]|nr:TonB-dependent receptor [Bacteroidia bacterium]MBT8287681.1 TonB-dependent receptor [Bacteroidia bacterium]NNF73962.1 TonB-dependent receptor [Flavobacteriaceae bacterium]NNK72484.1 TonB-dependent receptor [Flavobacteriaceae bacterium]
MKKLFILFILFPSVLLNAQEKTTDSTKVEKLDEVLITAIRVKPDAPITHSNIDNAELRKRNLGQDLPVLLNYLPSVVTTSDAGAGVGYTGIRVRGVSAQSTNITINGIPYNDAESLGTFWVDLPDFSSSVESLQLQRGVGTSTNGAGAFGASVNILTDAISEKAYAELSNSFGSFNTRKHTLKFSTGLLNNRIEVSGRLSQIKSDGYIDRAESDLKSYFLQGAYSYGNTFIKALAFGGHEITYQAWNGIDAETLASDRTFNPSGIYTDENGAIRFYDNEVDNYKQDHYQLHWNERLSSNWRLNMGLNYTYGRGYFEQYKEEQSFTDYGLSPVEIGNETINTTDLIRRRWLDNDFYVVNSHATYTDEKFSLDFGGSYSYYSGDHFGEIIWAQFASDSSIRDRYYDGVGKKADFNLFGKTTVKLSDKWQLYGDLQIRMVNYKTDGLNSDRNIFEIDETYQFFNPKGGVNFNMDNRNSFYFSYARANREPSRSDFESDPDIDPEQLNDFELGWRYVSERLQLSLNGYYMLYNEQLVLSGAIDDVGTPIRNNGGESYRLGLELDLNFQLNDQWSLRPNISWSSNKNKETIASIDGMLVNLGKTNISFSPEIVAANALTYQPNKNLQFSFLTKYVGEQFMGNTDSPISKLDSYFVNDVNVSYEFSPGSIFNSVAITALVNNIFNEKYVSNGYYFTYDDDFSVPGVITTIEGAGYYPQATTNFLLGLTLKF